jgi:protein TonB
MLSVAVHLVTVGLAVWLMQRTVAPPPRAQERMVFIEPVAPPPALGAPAGPAAVPADSVAAERIAESPKELVKAARLVVPPKVTDKAPTPAALPNGNAQASTAGLVGGVAGGEVGGKTGTSTGGHGDAPIPSDQVGHPPVLVTRVLPTYPPAARAHNVQGRVVLRAVVDCEGRVEESVTVLESIPLLDAPAVDALRRWRFEPGRNRDGQPVRVVVDVPIRFELR